MRMRNRRAFNADGIGWTIQLAGAASMQSVHGSDNQSAFHLEPACRQRPHITASSKAMIVFKRVGLITLNTRNSVNDEINPMLKADPTSMPLPDVATFRVDARTRGKCVSR